MKLISTTEFVLTDKSIGSEFANRVYNYANFLTQPLTLGMFVPCDEDGRVLKDVRTEHDKIQDNIGNCRLIHKEELEYNKAKERVLFEGFGVYKRHDYYVVFVGENKDNFIWLSWNDSKTVENTLANRSSHLQPTLTKSALKQLGI